MIKLLVKKIKINYVENPDDLSKAMIYNWMETEHGTWVKNNSKEINVVQDTWPMIDDSSVSYTFSITAKFNIMNAFIYKLKWYNVT